MRKIIHIDMDCFYAAIEMRDNPELAKKPIAVGGSPETRSVLCTSNYLARQYGVRSAMASRYAKKLCPELIILPVNMQKYRIVSAQIQQIFFQYTHLVEPLSLDEAFLDVTACQQFQNSATFIAEAIRKKIKDQCQLTASAGIASNKFLAKIASEINKPDGQYVIPPQKIAAFIKTLPVKKIWGVGKATEQKLKNMNILNCLDLQAKTRDELQFHFGKFGLRLYELARGIDTRPVEPFRARKSLSVENTFQKDLMSLDDGLKELPRLYQQLQERLVRKAEHPIHKQFVKIKFFDFKITNAEIISQTLSLENYYELFKIGYQRRSVPVRLIGLGVGFKENKDHLQQELEL